MCKINYKGIEVWEDDIEKEETQHLICDGCNDYILEDDEYLEIDDYNLCRICVENMMKRR